MPGLEGLWQRQGLGNPRAGGLTNGKKSLLLAAPPGLSPSEESSLFHLGITPRLYFDPNWYATNTATQGSTTNSIMLFYSLKPFQWLLGINFKPLNYGLHWNWLI